MTAQTRRNGKVVLCKRCKSVFANEFMRCVTVLYPVDEMEGALLGIGALLLRKKKSH